MSARRKFAGGKLVIASHNPGKLKEIAALLAPFNVEAISAGALGLPEPEETGTTFIANAELKAHASAQGAQLPALADDSGLCVDALGGDPGIYSARWAGPQKDFGYAMERVRKALEEKGAKPPFTAQFVSVLSLAWPDGHVESFEGILQGQIGFPPRGHNGFGYDPIFTRAGDSQTFGEIDAEAKHAISHRALAFRQLIDGCFK